MDCNLLDRTYNGVNPTKYLKEEYGLTISTVVKYLFENISLLDSIAEDIPYTRDYRLSKWLRNHDFRKE